MLRTLLAERFNLKQHRETRENAVYELLADKPVPRSIQSRAKKVPKLERDFISMGICVGSRTSSQFSSLSRYWTIRPNRAELGPCIPVLDRTELPGVYDLTVDAKPELGTDSFTLWQRALREQLGLRIESRRVQ